MTMVSHPGKSQWALRKSGPLNGYRSVLPAGQVRPSCASRQDAAAPKRGGRASCDQTKLVNLRQPLNRRIPERRGGGLKCVCGRGRHWPVLAVYAHPAGRRVAAFCRIERRITRALALTCSMRHAICGSAGLARLRQTSMGRCEIGRAPYADDDVSLAARRSSRPRCGRGQRPGVAEGKPARRRQPVLARHGSCAASRIRLRSAGVGRFVATAAAGHLFGAPVPRDAPSSET